MAQTLAGARSRFEEMDLALCQRLSSAQRRALWLRFFRAVSRLGDGPVWYALAVGLPLVAGRAALPAVARMAAVGGVATLVSKVLKHVARRTRPYLAHAEIHAGVAPLDRFSFPSGHTLHAVAFTTVLGVTAPSLLVALVPITAAIALSRVVLGLHYPSDVAAGVGLGMILAWGVLAVL